MRALNIVGGSIVLVCVVAVSYSHTLALFGMGGFTGIFQHMAVIAVEVTFLLGALNMVVSRFKGRHPGIPAIIGGLFGVSIVGWGNIEAGVNYGIHGVLLGAAIPISLIIAEAILSKAILQRMKEQPEGEPAITYHTNEEQEKEPTITQESPNQWEDSQERNHEGELPPITTQDTSAEQKEPPITTQEEKNITQAITHNGEPSPMIHPMPPTGNEESPDHSPTVAQESPKDHPEATHNGELSPSDSPSLWEEPPKESPSTDGDTQEDTQHTQESPKIETDPAVIYQIAWEMYEKNGEPPTRRGLAEAANTTEHRARKAIDRLKAELEQQREVVA